MWQLLATALGAYATIKLSKAQAKAASKAAAADAQLAGGAAKFSANVAVPTITVKVPTLEAAETPGGELARAALPYVVVAAGLVSVALLVSAPGRKR